MKELKELADFVLEIGNAVSRSLNDGKLELKDLVNLSGAVMLAIPALQGVSAVGDEFLNMDAAQREELKAHISVKLALDPSHEKVEAISEGVLKVVVDMNSLIKQLVGGSEPAPAA